jgi:ABC-type polysaccharide/polyol phosphate transport system ATPase subunit
VADGLLLVYFIGVSVAELGAGVEWIMAAMVLDGVNVDFPIYGTQRSLRAVLFNRATGGLIQHEGKNQDRVVVKALVDVSLKLEEGDRLGLIGHNGSGKSTLLKVMAGIYKPIAGQILVEGRVTPLFDLMPGLDHEDNAYENIFTAGLLLGLSRKQIEGKIPQIEEFCELGEYLSLPVRTYSAGMVTRLGFALSTALDPGILLVDEGIAAGDARFTERAAKRMKELFSRSSIMVLASHVPHLVKSICNKAALMDAGRILAIGPVDEILDKYYGSINQTEALKPSNAFGRLSLFDWKKRTWADAGARIDWVSISAESENTGDGSIHVGGTIRISFAIRFEQKRIGSPIKLAVTLATADGIALANMVDTDSSFFIEATQVEEAISVLIPDIRFYPGTYYASLWVGSMTSETWDHVHDCIAFEVVAGGSLTQRRLPRAAGMIFLTPIWTRT